MPARVVLPAELLRRPFTTTEARALGVTGDVLRPPHFATPHRGVRVHVDLEASPLLDIAAARLALPPDAVFSEWTAVRLHGLPTPWGRPDPVGRLVQARVPRRVVRPEVRGVACTHLRGSDQVLGLSGGEVGALLPRGASLLAQDPVSAWCDLVPGLGTTDGVALGDAVRRHHATQEEMATAVAARSGHRGARKLRLVFAAVRHQVDSPAETEVRMLLVGAGLPEPECGRWVPDATGRLWQVDMVWQAQRVVVEYDGDVHRLKGRVQWRHDEDKRARLREGGWDVVVLTGDALSTTRRWAREDTIARVRKALNGS